MPPFPNFPPSLKQPIPVAIDNRLKYKKLNIQATKPQTKRRKVASLSHPIQMHHSISKYYNQIMNPTDKDEHRKRSKVQQSESNSEEDAEGYDDDHYESDFIVDDEDESAGYEAPYRRDYSDDEEKGKKSKKQKKQQKKKKKKEKKRREEEESYDEDDLDLIDNDQKLTRLKKKKEPRRESDEDEDPYLYDMGEDDAVSGEEMQSDDDAGYNRQQDESDSLSEIQEVIHQQKEIFDPSDLKKLTIEDEDRDLAQIDLPQRYIGQLKIYAKNLKKSFGDVREILETEDKVQEAEWIYYKIRTLGLLESYEEKQCKERIRAVLDCIHKEHLDIMYVFYYRKRIFVDYLNLQVLWKIQEFDEEWYSFREKQKKCVDFLQIFLPSFTEVPKELIDFAYQCSEQRALKYFEQFAVFAEAKWMMKPEQPQNSKKNEKRLSKFAFISQIAQKGVAHELESSQIFLSPQNLCHNLKARNQQRKPRTPGSQPKDEFQRIIRSTDSGRDDRAKFYLLTPENRFKSITKYLCHELYTYPELRRLLKEKYYKKLIISTQPTKKGIQDIDLYSVYFPVKRIKDKPVSTLKREIWILAQKAQKLDLITIELRFQWELPNADKAEKQSKERDTVYMELARAYFDISNSRANEIWNIFRKRILHGLLNEHFLPNFTKQVKDDLTREGEREIINACCQKLRLQLNKGPSLKEGKPIKILSLVLEENKLGVAFVDQSGKAQFTFNTIINNDEELRRFVGDENLSVYIKEYKPDMILIAANCKRAQTLRKQLRDPKLFPQSIFCAFGQSEIPRLVAKRQIIRGQTEEETVLQAISMARLKKNPMSQIISLWSEKTSENGILSMNLHQYQGFVDDRKLRESLEKVIIEVVNMVGLDINEVNRNQHLQTQLEFVSGLGPKKAFVLLQKLKEDGTEILNRNRVSSVLSEIVSKNCCPFLKVETSFHKGLFDKPEKEPKKGQTVKQYEYLNLLDMTRIPEEWYSFIMKKMNESITNKSSTVLSEMRKNKQFSKLSDENIVLLDIFKNPEKVRGIDWKNKDNTSTFDDEVVKSEIMSRFRNPRDPQRVMENREIFFNLLRESAETLKRYMIMQVKVLSMKKNYLNVIIPENGLFGYIKLQGKTPEQLQKYEKLYEKGTTIKAVIIGFPFDEKTFRDQPSEEQELLKIEMALDFPHKDNDRHDGSRHDCMNLCFPAIVKEIHPLIDLDKDRFELKKEDRPVIEVKEEKIVPKNLKADLRRISHPKYKNIGAAPAIEMIKDSQISIGDFIIRPSSQGPEYLTVTWKFFKGVIVHIKVKCEHRGINSLNMTYRIEDRDNRSYNSLEEIIEKCIRPMNVLVQDITSNKKFLDLPIDAIENQTRRETKQDSSHIYYYFGVSEDYPQFVLLIYMFKERNPIRELIKVRSSGFYFHDQQFSTTRDLIAWFKEHLKEKEYQKYVKNANLTMQKR